MRGPHNRHRKSLLVSSPKQPFFASKLLLRILPERVSFGRIFRNGQTWRWFKVNRRGTDEDILPRGFREELEIKFDVGNLVAQEINHDVGACAFQGTTHAGQILAIGDYRAHSG